MNRNPKEKPCRLYLRVSPTEKKKITELANCCGIPVAEYLRKRALGCSVKAVVPDAFYIFNEKLSELLNRDLSPETEAAALKLFDDIYAEIIDTPKQSKREIIREILTGVPGKASFVGKRSIHGVESLSAFMTKAMNGV